MVVGVGIAGFRGEGRAVLRFGLRDLPATRQENAQISVHLFSGGDSSTSGHEGRKRGSVIHSGGAACTCVAFETPRASFQLCVVVVVVVVVVVGGLTGMVQLCTRRAQRLRHATAWVTSPSLRALVRSCPSKQWLMWQVTFHCC